MGGYIRFFFVVLLVVIEFIISLPFLLISWLIGRFNVKASDAMTLFIMRTSFKTVLAASGVKVHVSGRENLPGDKPVLYVGNHRSFFDVLTTYPLFPSMTSFVAKKQFAKVPALSWWMKMLHNLFIDRDDIKQGLQVILQAIDYVKSGMSVFIYPEGTRNKTQEDILPFHEGSFKIAVKSGCPIIPVTTYNMSAVFEDHFPKIIKSHVYIDFGTPIDPASLEGNDKKFIGAYVRGIMLEKYKELKAKHEKLNSR